ncbi:MAG TPA: hypothetical protein VHS31_17365 [Tepidisphaeraceae bacterium]|nr:hypothetical protein [Tepidisphaeraceae bacterium]
MRRGRRIKLIVLLCVVVPLSIILWPSVPLSARRALQNADQYELLSLDPSYAEKTDPNTFHRHQILGRILITDPTVRDKLNNALRHGALWPGAGENLCFNPRHGIHIVQGGHTIDFVICFECRQAYGYRDDVSFCKWLTDTSPQAVFDEVLKNAGVPLPKADSD